MPDINLICDTSGSMVEAGKRFLVRSLVRQVEQLMRFHLIPAANLHLFAWGEEMEKCIWNVDDEVPPEIISCKGRVDISVLARFLRQQTNEKSIIFSDCSWEDGRDDTLVAISSLLNQPLVRVVPVGADANLLQAGKMALPCDNALPLLEEWLSR